jgi:hypothetical protein
VKTIEFFKAIKKHSSVRRLFRTAGRLPAEKAKRVFSPEKFAFRLVFRGERAYNKQALVFCGFLRFNFSRRFE